MNIYAVTCWFFGIWGALQAAELNLNFVAVEIYLGWQRNVATGMTYSNQCIWNQPSHCAMCLLVPLHREQGGCNWCTLFFLVCFQCPGSSNALECLFVFRALASAGLSTTITCQCYHSAPFSSWLLWKNCKEQEPNHTLSCTPSVGAPSSDILYIFLVLLWEQSADLFSTTHLLVLHPTTRASHCLEYHSVWNRLLYAPQDNFRK